MRRLLALSLFFFTWAAALPETAAAEVINGPVSMTVLSNPYDIYYTTIDYYAITENYSGGISGSALGSTSSPNNLIGISSVSPDFLQPWWGNADAAKDAALAWRNAGSWPNDASQYPNASQTPYFAYATINGGEDVAYAYADTNGAFTSQQDIDTISSFALATSVSN